jgi:hypothetical protein
MNERAARRRFYTQAILACVWGCVWCVGFTVLQDQITRTSTGLAPNLYGVAVFSATAAGLIAFGYVVNAVTFAAWIRGSIGLRYGHLLVAMVLTTLVLAGWEYYHATLLSDYKLMALGIAARNQGAKVWFCGMSLFVVMRFISLALAVSIEAPGSDQPSRRLGVEHLLRLTAVIAVLMASYSLIDEVAKDGTLANFSNRKRIWIWLAGMLVLLVTALSSRWRRREVTPQPTRSAWIRGATLLAAVMILIGSSQWFDFFSANFMTWFAIDWSDPNPIPIRGNIWNIFPRCAEGGLAMAIPLSCAIGAGTNWRGVIAFVASGLIVPVWILLREPDMSHAAVAGAAVLLTALPTWLVAWRLARQGYRLSLS